MRSYQEAVEVRVPARDEVQQDLGVPGAPGDGGLPSAAPSMFVWRGRLYVVRKVLSRWREQAPWWRAGALQDDSSALPAGEQLIWRVEASAGRALGTQAYDLACAPPSSQLGSSWTLLRVAD